MPNMLPEHLRPICLPLTVPVGPDGRWIDNGIWRERGVTHWHLLRRDWNRSDRENRFDTARAMRERMHPTHGVARDPYEVSTWLIEEALRAAKECPCPEAMLRSSWMDTEERIYSRRETTFRAAMFGRDVCSMMGLGELRIADMGAYAMTAELCALH